MQQLSEETRLRDRMCRLGELLYLRGMTHGSTGNISARLEDGRILVTPTGSSLGLLEPEALAVLDAQGHHIDGAKPTKEVPLHTAFYGLRAEQAQAVVHLHSHHAVHLSMLEVVDPDDMLPPLTPYALMQLGRVRLLPFFRPGDPAMGRAIAEMDPRTSAVVLANHGPVVAGASLDKAMFAIEELEATARLAIDTRGQAVRPLSRNQIADLVKVFDIDM